MEDQNKAHRYYTVPTGCNPQSVEMRALIVKASRSATQEVEKTSTKLEAYGRGDVVGTHQATKDCCLHTSGTKVSHEAIQGHTLPPFRHRVNPKADERVEPHRDAERDALVKENIENVGESRNQVGQKEPASVCPSL